MPDSIQIEIIYCPTGHKPQSQTLRVEAGCTAARALAQCTLPLIIGSPKTDDIQVGIYGKKCTFDTRLKNRDRLEIYRPLLLSPTEARRLRARTRTEN